MVEEFSTSWAKSARAKFTWAETAALAKAKSKDTTGATAKDTTGATAKAWAKARSSV